MKAGDQVIVRAYGGKELVRRVFEEKDEVVLICREEEWQAAQQEHREPLCVGFPKRDVISPVIDQ